MRAALKWAVVCTGTLAALSALSIYWLAYTESGLRWVLKRAPQGIEIATVKGNLQAASLTALKVDLPDVQIEIGSLDLAWNPATLLKRRLQIESLSVTGLDVTVKQPSSPRQPAYQKWPGLDLPINLDLQQANIEKIKVLDGQQESLALDNIVVAGRIDNNVLSLQRLLVKASDYRFSLSGRADLSGADSGEINLANDIQWTLSAHPISSSGTVSGTWQALNLKQSVVRPSSAKIDITFENVLSDLLSWHGSIETAAIAEQRLADEAFNIGEGAFKTYGQIVPHAGVESLQVSLAGQVTGGNSRLSNWKLEAAMQFMQGDLMVEQLSLHNLFPDMPDSLQAQGVINNLFGFINQEHGPGQVNFSGRWSDLRWPLNQSSPAISMSGRFDLLGSSSDYRLTATAQGSSQGKPLNASANIQLLPNAAVIEQFNISSGDTTASFSGSVGENINVSWDLQSPGIQSLIPQLKGDLISKGSLQGVSKKPDFTFTSSSRQLAMAGYAAQNMQLHAEGSLANLSQPLDVDLRASELRFGTETLARSVQASVKGTALKHQLAIDSSLGAGLGQADAQLAVRMNGGLDGELWRGEVSLLNLADTEYGQWQLTEPAKLLASAESLTVSRTCLAQGAQNICAELNQDQQLVQASAKLDNLSLASLPRMLYRDDIHASGNVSGKLNYSKHVDQASARINAFLRSDGAKLIWLEADEEDDAREELLIENARMTLEAAQDMNFSARLDLANGDYIEADIGIAANIGELTLPSAALNGQARMVLNKLDNLPPSMLNDVALDGSLIADLALSGTVQNPNARMQANLQSASARIRELDLLLENINLRASADNSSVIDVEGSLTSGKGELGIRGNLDFSDLRAPGVTVNLSGQGLQLVNTPEVRATGSLNVNTRINAQLIDMQGELTVEQAELDFKVPEGVILASDDVVLMGVEATPRRARRKLDLTIDLGQKTRIQAQGLDARLTGNLRVFQEPESILRGSGEIEVVDGVYRAYGQNLSIDRGRLIFNSGSIDDPNLDLRAQKSVDGITAGVSVIGLASAPQLELYSSPTLTDQDILAVLLFDKPLAELGSQDGFTLLRIANSLRGGEQSSITKATENIRQSLGLSELQLVLNSTAPSIQAGKQLSSKFYIGYGYGLLDATQALILRYKLSKDWSIKADVGADSGADLRYQIER